jgi:hypothetical protein
MNTISMTGRLAADPDLRQAPGGQQSVCKLRLAVEGLARKNATGFVTVTCFGAPGQAAARVLSRAGSSPSAVASPMTSGRPPAASNATTTKSSATSSSSRHPAVTG